MVRTYRRYAHTVAVVGIAFTASWSSEVSGADIGPNAKGDLSLEEVVVTAQRREERLRDVPLSVTALTGEMLETGGVRSSLDLTMVTPGLTFTGYGAFAQPAVRGISTTLSGPGEPGNVAIYVDGVLQPVPQANFMDLANVQRVEILKGPQGTLFGRNATGGAINVITRNPVLNEASGQLTGSYGRFNEGLLSGYCNQPVSDSFAFNLSAYHREDDGYSKDVVRGTDLAKTKMTTATGKLAWFPSQNSTWTLALDYSSEDVNTALSSAALNGNTLARAFQPTITLPTKPFDTALTYDPFNKTIQKGAALHGDVDFGPVTLTSITAYRRIRFQGLSDSDASPAPLVRVDLNQPTRVASQEFVLSSKSAGPWTWIAGLYGYREKTGYDNNAIIQGVPPAYAVTASTVNRTHLDAKSYAVFGEVTRKLTDAWSIAGGARFTHEEKDFEIAQTTRTGTATAQGDKSWNDTSPRASIRYKQDDNTTAYATYTKGFKSGQFNPTSLVTQPVEPEIARAYELGLKSRMGNVDLTTAVFYNKYEDIQVQSFNPIVGAASISLRNAAQARVYGGELEATAIVTSRTQVRVAVSVLDTKFTDFTDAEIFVPSPAGGNVRSANADATGNQLIRAPQWTATLGVDQTVPLAGGQLKLSGTAFFSDKFYYDVGNRVAQDPYQIVNLSAAWSPSSERYRVTLWGTNVTDTTYYSSVIVSSVTDSVNYARPASYGLRLDFYW